MASFFKNGHFGWTAAELCTCVTDLCVFVVCVLEVHEKYWTASYRKFCLCRRVYVCRIIWLPLSAVKAWHQILVKYIQSLIPLHHIHHILVCPPFYGINKFPPAKHIFTFSILSCWCKMYIFKLSTVNFSFFCDNVKQPDICNNVKKL